MCWLSGILTCRLSSVMRSPPARRSLSWIQSTVDWCMAPRKWGFDLKSNSTCYPDHGNHGDPPPTWKIPMVEPGIEPGTSCLVVRSSDHQTTRLVRCNFRSSSNMKNFHVRCFSTTFFIHDYAHNNTCTEVFLKFIYHFRRNIQKVISRVSRQSTANVILWRVRVTIVAVKR